MTLPARRQLRQRMLSDGSGGILNEKVLLLVFRSTNWNPFLLGRAACVSKKMCAITKRLLWKEFCISRAPRMVTDLITGCKNGSTEGGWDAVGRLFFICGGCQPTANFRLKATLPAHFVRTSRFSKTSGKSFLIPQCRTDTLYVTDLCEHVIGPDEDDLGIFRGIFRGFSSSRTRLCLIQRKVQLEQAIFCPFCRAGVWSMTNARMIPKSAARRLAAYDGHLEYFVCLNGHMHAYDGETAVDLVHIISESCLRGRGSFPIFLRFLFLAIIHSNCVWVFKSQLIRSEVVSHHCSAYEYECMGASFWVLPHE